MVNDAETARRIAEQDDTDPDEPTSSLREQTPEVVVLQAIFDVLIKALGGKDTWPRPVTAVDRAREDLTQESMDKVVSLMTPWAIDRD